MGDRRTFRRFGYMPYLESEVYRVGRAQDGPAYFMGAVRIAGHAPPASTDLRYADDRTS